MTFTEYPYNNLRKRFGALLSDQGFDLMNKCVRIRPRPAHAPGPAPPRPRAPVPCSPRFLTYFPGRRVSAEDGLKHEYFRETPLPIDPSMFPTWPAKSEQQRVKRGTSPRPPEGGLGYSQLVSRGRGRGGRAGVPELGLAWRGPHAAAVSAGRRRPEGDGFPPHHHQPGCLGRRPGLQPQVLRFGPPGAVDLGGLGAPGSGPRCHSGEARQPGTHLQSRTASLGEFSTFWFYFILYICRIKSHFPCRGRSAVCFRAYQPCSALCPHPTPLSPP